jgi:hypothetical protein
MEFYRPPLNRVDTYLAPYVAVKNNVAPNDPALRDPLRWVNTLRCNRTKSESIRMPTPADPCTDCTQKRPFFYKQHNFQHPLGMQYPDILFTGDFDHEFYHGCLDPRDAWFDSCAQVHCEDRCKGKPKENPPCCLTLDVGVLDQNKCARDAAAAALPKPAPKQVANYPPIRESTMSLTVGAPTFTQATDETKRTAIDLVSRKAVVQVPM